MPNSTETNRAIYLDTFTSAISLYNLRVQSIEWVNVGTGKTCTISLGASGPKIIEWVSADKVHIKYLDSLPFKELYIGVSGVTAGSVIIIIR